MNPKNLYRTLTGFTPEELIPFNRKIHELIPIIKNTIKLEFNEKFMNKDE